MLSAGWLVVAVVLLFVFAFALLHVADSWIWPRGGK